MYSPTSRLLAVLELLQSHSCLGGAELARRLEVDGRTIRRYILRLQEMGIPVEAAPGRGGGYRLKRGFRMPPLMLSDAEAVALTLGLMTLRDTGLGLDKAAVASALAKTERVMPAALHAQSLALQTAIRFHLHLYQTPAAMETLTLLARAVQQGQRVQLAYQSYGGARSTRGFEPYGIVMNEGCWYTAGFCRLRGDLRTFRIDRIQALELRDIPFERPADFDCLAFVLGSLSAGGEPVEVLLHTRLDVARCLWEPAFGRLEAVPEGVLLRRGGYHLDWVALMLLRCDFPVEIRRPAALRVLLRERGLAALRMSGEMLS